MVVRETFSDTDVDRLSRALADADRRDNVRQTLTNDASISELASSYDMSFAAVQKHVAILEEARLVTKEPRGCERIVRADPTQIAGARELLTRLDDLWRARFDQLDDVQADSVSTASPNTAPPHSPRPTPDST